ncbi:unnamed protein product (macronuclear) [Paramecium tetraurelia]|uniref:Uncharacterized protein n=1 Tax=Paramecium tetraurelia TaxID=5888 RepID=A0DAE9_PARTE|nr:uncharacterized protein GSPATT00014923001 [Paramecium tetraurelia]CAK80016.1 unnamed protein product [Paramecium tetraurelia]|eukprot:XP_001447413.1 hypothetical protein (macronuclear) [Paramecium tetraurelia strain d4-2]
MNSLGKRIGNDPLLISNKLRKSRETSLICMEFEAINENLIDLIWQINLKIHYQRSLLMIWSIEQLKRYLEYLNNKIENVKLYSNFKIRLNSFGTKFKRKRYYIQSSIENLTYWQKPIQFRDNETQRQKIDIDFYKLVRNAQLPLMAKQTAKD